jgi:hypothetical protein
MMIMMMMIIIIIIIIITELQISQITEFIYQHRKNWKEHVDRMSSDRIPKRF